MFLQQTKQSKITSLRHVGLMQQIIVIHTLTVFHAPHVYHSKGRDK